MHARKYLSRANARGLTLLEVVISVSVLSMVSILIYGAFSIISRGKQTAAQLSERYRLGRVTMNRMSRELSTAFLSLHNAATPVLQARVTAFFGTSRRVDFDSFSHRRIIKDAHESDQCELSYFTIASRKNPKQIDLVRREQAILDDQPGKGGVVQVLVDDVDTFSIRYLDAMSGLWTDTWDSTSHAGQLLRLPIEVELNLVLKGGPAGAPIRLRTKTPLLIHEPLSFALK